MLHPSRISQIQANTEEWKQFKHAKFSSSEIYRLMSEKGLGETGLTYIKEKVHEELTGEPIRIDLDTDDMRWGHLYETEAIMKIQQKYNWPYVVTQTLIMGATSRFCSTPDALRLLSISPNDEYEVENIEVKCPPKNYIDLFMCRTPAQLKIENKKFYWQVIDQADVCGVTKKSHFAAYHPKFRAGNMRHIEFDYTQPVLGKDGKKTFPLFDDLRLLRLRKAEAELKFMEIRDQLLQEDLF